VEKDTAQTRTLHRALDVAGTVEQLARLLGAQPSDLASWLSGARQTPTEIYLRALDMVAQGDRFRAEKS
jgi:DNA-binding transcriptional regulator YdaS (Cro superfamily)